MALEKKKKQNKNDLWHSFGCCFESDSGFLGGRYLCIRLEYKQGGPTFHKKQDIVAGRFKWRAIE